MSVHILGIRHHGPGSAKAVKTHLQKLKPDCVLIEGPPDSEDVLPLVMDKKMKPPVALLVYMEEEPQRAVFYPFAEFSPEWQAMQYALKKKVALHFMDLPIANRIALELKKEETEKTEEENTTEPVKTEEPEVEKEASEIPVNHDPFRYLAEAAGYKDGELWWEYTFEQRENSEDCFEAIQEAIHVLRTELPEVEDEKEQLREAFMRKTIREAEAKYKKIAIICGAWHGPALEDRTNEKEDAALLKKLPAVKKIQSTWVPWTFSRLSMQSGYGAGIRSPGWYKHIWENKNFTESWMTKVARTFRKENMDVSVAHVIESVRLADALASIRNIPRPGLVELNEATQSVICMGDEIPLQLIQKELIIGKALGKVPDSAPKVPLQVDLERLQKKLRLQATAESKDLELDLRKDLDLERSHFLHRLNILGIHWGKNIHAKGKGTFWEAWRLKWEPELSVSIIEMGIWGNTIRDASLKYIQNRVQNSNSLPEITGLFEKSLFADLPETVSILVHRVDNLAAVCGDVFQLMEAISPLVNAAMGNVRKTDAEVTKALIENLVVRTCINLPNACYSLDDDAARATFERIASVDSNLKLINNDSLTERWVNTLKEIMDTEDVHGIIHGKCVKLLLDNGIFNSGQVEEKLELALSVGVETAYSASWLEGFLQGAAQLLLYDDSIFKILDAWIAKLDKEKFVEILPLLRRTFSNFSDPERRQIGEKARGVKIAGTSELENKSGFNPKRGEKTFPLVTKLLDLETK
ncbi:MAG: hypothetical protein H7A25_04585 [Leptospiraceae bacterium]|nr:hypothetical protein [Leptospiraceae bacterium]MCP5499153.1 hypothetical protein [Leptospiraceae bacterium]